MTPAEESRAAKLLGLARERFSAELQAVEEQIVRHSCGFADPGEGGPELAWHASGREAGLDRALEDGTRLLGPYVGPGNRPLPGWPGPQVRAGFLRWLLLDPEAAGLLDPKGVRVWGARLAEPLNLMRCRVSVVLEFRYCLLEKELQMDWGQMKEVSIWDSTVLGWFEAQGTTFGGSVFAGDSGFEEIRANAAVIEGQLVLGGSHVAGRVALDGAMVTGSALLNDGFACEGEVSLAAAQIGAQLSLAGARLEAAGYALRDALTLDGASVGQSVYLNDAVVGAQVSMTGTRVEKMVYCQGSKIRALNAEELEANQVVWTRIPKWHRALLDLKLAKIRTLLVDESSLAATTCFRLNHLQLQAMTESSGHLLTVGRCIEWLDLQPWDERAEAQPWMQLSRMREAAGDKKGARHLVYQLRKRQVISQWPGREAKARARRGVAMLFARLEEQPFRILWPLGMLLLLGTLVFHGYRAHFAETSESAYRATHTACAAGQAGNCPVGAAYPRFSSFVYTLENTLPVVKLGQDAAWAPRAESAGTRQGIYWVLVSLRWFLILSGWAMGIILGAAITARFRA